MKYLVISEDRTIVSGFREMGLDTILVENESNAISAVTQAIESRRYGTLLVSRKVSGIAYDVIERHRGRGTLPFVMTLKA